MYSLEKICFCGSKFNDNTKSKNRRYCSEKCRMKAENQLQHNKIRHHLYYLRIIKRSRHGESLGTITDRELDIRIRKLLQVI